MSDHRTEAGRAREPKSAPPLALSRVKAVAQQDESIGKMGVDATYLIGRCTDAFLADLVKASVDRARAAGHRKSDENIRKRAPTSKTATQQVLPEDVAKAVAEEERFDFLRPVLRPPQDGGQSLGAAGAKGKRQRPANSGQEGTSGGRARKGKKRMDMESTGAAAAAAAATSGTASKLSDLRASGGPIAPTAEAPGSGLLALEGLDDEGRRRALLGGLGTEPVAAREFGDDDEHEDYDNF